LDLIHAAVAFASAFLAGAINSVAGGGTLISFPALVWHGLTAITANATRTVHLGRNRGERLGYRRELSKAEARSDFPQPPRRHHWALLLRLTKPEFFDRLVPFLVLLRPVFAAQEGAAPVKTGDPEPTNRRNGLLGRSSNWPSFTAGFAPDRIPMPARSPS
jgi:hypothetical protein